MCKYRLLLLDHCFIVFALNENGKKQIKRRRLMNTSRYTLVSICQLVFYISRKIILRGNMRRPLRRQSIAAKVESFEKLREASRNLEKVGVNQDETWRPAGGPQRRFTWLEYSRKATLKSIPEKASLGKHPWPCHFLELAPVAISWKIHSNRMLSDLIKAEI